MIPIEQQLNNLKSFCTPISQFPMSSSQSPTGHPPLPAWLPTATNGPEVPTDATPSTLPLLTLDKILSYASDPKEEIWPEGVLCMGVPTSIIGAPGVGKSRLILQAAICTILGKPFLRWQTNGFGLKWLFLQTENATRRLKSDLTAMTEPLLADELTAC